MQSVRESSRGGAQSGRYRNLSMGRALYLAAMALSGRGSLGWSDRLRRNV
jgi:hypothetical protein